MANAPAEEISGSQHVQWEDKLARGVARDLFDSLILQEVIQGCQVAI